MKKIPCLLVVSAVLSFCAWGLPVLAQTPSVQTLSGVLKQTWETNPTLKAAQAAQKAVEEEGPQAQAGWKPTLDADASVTRTDPAGSALDADTASEAGLSVSQPLYRGGRTVAEIRAANNTIKAGAARLDLTGQTVLLSAATAYMDVVRDEALVDLGQQNRAVIEKQLKASEARFQVGDVTRTDVSQAKARLAQAQADLISARGNLRVSRATFLQVTGLVPEHLEARPGISLSLPATLDEAVALAEAKNPGIQVARYEYRASDDDTDAVFGELMPEVSAFGSLTRDWGGRSTEGTASAVGVRASVPLYEAGSVRSRLRQARHTADQKNMTLVAARRLAHEDIVSGWENLQAARAEIESRRAQVDSAALARDGVHQEADVGARTILDALDADQELLNAQVALVTAQRNEIVAQFTLAAALGLLGPGVF